MNWVKELQFIAIASISLALAGCDEKIQTVDWYKTHEKERKEMVEECNSKFKDTPNCKNAKNAEISVTMEPLKKSDK